MPTQSALRDIANFDIMAGQESQQQMPRQQQMSQHQRQSQSSRSSSSNPADDFQEPNYNTLSETMIQHRQQARNHKRSRLPPQLEREAFADVKSQFGGFQQLSQVTTELPRVGGGAASVQIRKQRRANRRRRLPLEVEREAFHDVKGGYVEGMTQPLEERGINNTDTDHSLHNTSRCVIGSNGSTEEEDCGRYQLFLRVPISACQASQMSETLLYSLPNLPSIETVHLSSLSAQYPHIQNTPTLADNSLKQRFQGLNCVEWLKQKSELQTQKLQEEAERRTQQHFAAKQKSTLKTFATHSKLDASTKRRSSNYNTNRPKASQDKGYVSESKIEEQKARRIALKQKLEEESTGLQMPAPLKPR